MWVASWLEGPYRWRFRFVPNTHRNNSTIFIVKEKHIDLQHIQCDKVIYLYIPSVFQKFRNSQCVNQEKFFYLFWFFYFI